MKYIKYTIAFLLGLTALSCSEKLVKELEGPQGQDNLVTVRAAFSGEDLTKVGAGNGFSWSWSKTDKLAISSDGVTRIYKLVSGAGSKYAEFQGKAVEGETFTIQYPEEGASTADFSSQKQAGNNSTAHLRYAASLEGVNAYKDFAFNNTWAAEHGGSLRQTGILKLIINLPEGTVSVSKVSIKADAPVFYSGNGDKKVNSLEVELSDTKPDSRNEVTVWMTTSWNEVRVSAGDKLTIAITTDSQALEKVVEFTREGVIMGGKVNVFDATGSDFSQASHYSAGDGSESSPWIIKTLDELLYMKDDLAEGDIRYFKLGADIDMTGTDWKSLNGAGSFDKQIHFDGDGHTISNFYTSATTEYPSFFGVLYGTCCNVKFVNATVNTTSGGVGILGGYGGTASKPCVVRNVHVQGSVTGGNDVGGFFGTARGCTIENCSADVSLKGGQRVGGLVGKDATDVLIVRNCWTSGIIEATGSVVGGIIGDLTADGSSLYNCYSTMTIKTQFIFGGIVGRANKGAKTTVANCTNNTPGNHVEKCIAWNDRLESTCPDNSEHYSNGAIIGGTALKNYLTDCVRKSDLVLIDSPGNTATGKYLVSDQENADPDHILARGEGTYDCAYHGKAAAAGETLSQVAQRIGWSSEIWDFSSNIPTLK